MGQKHLSRSDEGYGIIEKLTWKKLIISKDSFSSYDPIYSDGESKVCFQPTCHLISEDRMILIGGDESRATYHIFCFKTNTWTEKDAMIGHKYHTSCLVTKKSTILVYGGMRTGWEFNRHIHEIKIFANEENWSRIDIPYGDAIPDPRRGHTAVLSPDERFMFIFGGEHLDLHPMNELWRFDIELKKWEEIIYDSLKPVPKIYDHEAVVIDNHMIVYGGEIEKYSESGCKGSEFFKYSFANNEWEIINYFEQTTADSFLLGRACFKMMLLKDIDNSFSTTSKIIIGTGEYQNDIFELRAIDDGLVSSFWILDYSQKIFTMVPVVYEHDSIQIPQIVDGYSLIQHKNRIYMFGGGVTTMRDENDVNSDSDLDDVDRSQWNYIESAYYVEIPLSYFSEQDSLDLKERMEYVTETCCEFRISIFGIEDVGCSKILLFL